MKKLWLLLSIPVLLLLWWSVGRRSAAPQIHFSLVRRVTIASTISTNGKAEPFQSAAARAETPGVVRVIQVQRGQRVTAGQTLVVLDRASAESDLATATARLQEAVAENETLGKGGRSATVASLQNAVESAKTALAVAQRNLESVQRMASQQAATRLQLQEAQDTVTRMQLQYQAALDQQRNLVTTSDKSVAEAKVRDAQAALDLARHRLTLTTITAPISGTLYEFDLKLGAYLSPGQLVGNIGDLEQMKVTVYVDEPDLGRIQVGMPVRITWDARPDEQWWGKVDHMPTQVVALNTRTVGEVMTSVSNPAQELLPGVTVNATVISKVVSDAIGIPKAALRTLNNASGVYKLTQNRKLVWVPVQTGVSDVSNVQIVNGLQLGDYIADRVIEPSDAEIKSGMFVRPVH